MRQIGEAFYGRAKAYDGALAVPGDVLAEALLRNVYSGTSGHAAEARRLATYTAEAVRHLAHQEVAGLAEGRVSFPDPAPLLASPPAPDIIPQAAP
jgi:cytochrome b pre-mRNA-processing protein 3